MKTLPIHIPDLRTKEDIEAIASDMSNAILDGSTPPPLDVYIRLQGLKKVIAGIENRIKGYAIEDAEAYGKGENMLNGIGFQVKDGATRWDYSNDAEWNRIKAELKEREDILKAIKKPIADPETGELIQPAIEKPQGQQLAVLFKSNKPK